MFRNLRTSRAHPPYLTPNDINRHTDMIKAAISMLSQGVKRIDHVAIVVANLDAALTFLSRHARHPALARDRLPPRGRQDRLSAARRAGGSEIELLEPTDPNSGVGASWRSAARACITSASKCRTSTRRWPSYRRRARSCSTRRHARPPRGAASSCIPRARTACCWSLSSGRIVSKRPDAMRYDIRDGCALDIQRHSTRSY